MEARLLAWTCVTLTESVNERPQQGVQGRPFWHRPQSLGPIKGLDPTTGSRETWGREGQVTPRPQRTQSGKYVRWTKGLVSSTKKCNGKKGDRKSKPKLNNTNWTEAQATQETD